MSVKSEWVLHRCIEPRKRQGQLLHVIERELGVVGQHDLLSHAGGPARRTDAAARPVILADFDIAINTHGATVCIDVLHSYCGWVAEVMGIRDKKAEYEFFREIAPRIRQELVDRYTGKKIEVVTCYADIHPVTGEIEDFRRL
ncbi:MAG: hypothetical protein BWY68_00424 [bacterium ADurb.Bin400]|nr:MAG: hypothetical protein BWY68_00424 [bacterium ADurb.Bin400]